MNSLEFASRRAVEKTSPDFAFCPGYDGRHEGRTFLPLGLAFSFFCIWVFAGLGSPAGVVRVMACRSTTNIRRSIYLLGGYNAFIYMPLAMVCICGRALHSRFAGRQNGRHRAHDGDESHERLTARAIHRAG